MEISYFECDNAAYIYLLNEDNIEGNVEISYPFTLINLNYWFRFDFNKNIKIVGIELLDANKTLLKEILHKIDNKGITTKLELKIYLKKSEDISYIYFKDIKKEDIMNTIVMDDFDNGFKCNLLFDKDNYWIGIEVSKANKYLPKEIILNASLIN